MKYRVKKRIYDGQGRWYPQAKPWWFPFYIDIEGDYDSYKAEETAWGLCKAHAVGAAKLQGDSVFLPLLLTVTLCAFALLPILSFLKHGGIAWLKSLIF